MRERQRATFYRKKAGVGEADGRYLSEAAVGVLIGRAAVGAVAAARLLLLVEQRRGVGQSVLQGAGNTE